jgi:eukaryotic-like serine/threonine-protein kinase
MASSDPDPRIGHVIDGRYRIVERLAQGGMGVVYRAERVPLGKAVAVKFLHSIYADDQASLARFERETRVLSKLTHPNCVSVIDFGVDSSPYLVMDFAGGITLRAALDDGKLKLDDAISIIRQVLAGLAHAHSHGIVHRDIKPANIMISDEIGTGRHVRLLDFGLARLATSANLTHSSVAIGTPSYMAPEQTLGGEVDVRTDIYQVGVVLFEMLTGERLFVAEDTASLLEMHRSAPVPHLGDVAPTMEQKPGLDEVLQKALAKDPADRWQTAIELSVALDDVISGRWRKPKKRSSGFSKFAAVLLFGGAAVAGISYWRDHGRPPPQQLVADPSVEAVISVERVDAAVERDAAPPGHDARDARDAQSVDAAVVDGAAPRDAAEAARDAASADADEVATEEVASADPGGSERPQDTAQGAAQGTTDERPPPPPPAVPLAKTLPAVNALIKKGQREVAIASLQEMWKKSPKDGRLPYQLGNLYSDKRWWTVGMQHYRAAISRVPAYKGNPILIRNAISAFGNAKSRSNAIYFVTKVIGPGAKGYVKTAAKSHPDPAVRKTATALLKRW